MTNPKKENLVEKKSLWRNHVDKSVVRPRGSSQKRENMWHKDKYLSKFHCTDVSNAIRMGGEKRGLYWMSRVRHLVK